MPKIALTFQYVVLCYQRENDTLQYELICIIAPGRDISIYDSLLFLSFEDNKNKKQMQVTIISYG